METPVKEVDQQQDNAPSTFQRVVKVLAYPLAIASGLWGASRSIHHNAYNTAKRLGAFDDILDELTPESKQQIQSRIQGIKTGDRKGLTLEQYEAAYPDTKLRYQNLADERLEKLGLTNMVKKWKFMEKSSKQIAVIEGMTIFGIAIGAMLTMADSKALSKLFSKKEKSDSEPQR